MKKFKIIILTLVTISCNNVDQENQINDVLIGHWQYCMRDGTYAEVKIDSKRISSLTTATYPDRLDYYWRLNHDTLIVDFDTTFSDAISRLIVKAKNENEIDLELEGFTYQMMRLINGDKSDFKNRSAQKNCQDLRPESEEKVPMGRVEDSFPEID